MVKNDVALFTNDINSLVPVDKDEKLSAIIRIIARQIKKSTFQFDIEKLEIDLSKVTHPELLSKLKDFFAKVRDNKRQRKTEKEQRIKFKQIAKAKKAEKRKEKKKRLKAKVRPSKLLPVIKSVPQRLIRKSIVNEEKRKEIKEIKIEWKTSRVPKSAKEGKQRIATGIYEPSISHSETEEDPIHRK